MGVSTSSNRLARAASSGVPVRVCHPPAARHAFCASMRFVLNDAHGRRAGVFACRAQLAALQKCKRGLHYASRQAYAESGMLSAAQDRPLHGGEWVLGRCSVDLGAQCKAQHFLPKNSINLAVSSHSAPFKSGECLIRTIHAFIGALRLGARWLVDSSESRIGQSGRSSPWQCVTSCCKLAFMA